MAGELRQRKNNKKDKSSKTKQDEKKKKQNAAKQQPDIVGVNAASQKEEESTSSIPLENDTLKNVFFKHPLIRVIPYILLPYTIYHTMYYISLQQPNIINTISLGIFKLRERVDPIHDTKQVLILGCEINENKHITAGLAHRSTLLNLEIGLETSNTLNYFCRDGTVSLFSIMKYIKPFDTMIPKLIKENGNDNDSKEELTRQLQEIQYNAWKELCIDRTESLVGLFHPKHHYPTKCDSEGGVLNWLGLSTGDTWSNCYARECLNLINDMWGCAWKENDNKDSDHDNSGACQPHYTKVLHQVRHPLHTINKLSNTFCSNDSDNDSDNNSQAKMDKLRNSFISLITSWFPFEEKSKDDDNGQLQLQLRDYSKLSCLDIMAIYVIEFHTTLLDAYKHGLIDGGTFQIETTSPCEVVHLGGFLNPVTNLYEPNINKLSKQCLQDYEYGNSSSDGSSSSSSPKEKELSKSRPQSKERFTTIKEISEGGKKKDGEDDDKNSSTRITLNDFQHDIILQKRLENLIIELGY